MDVVVSTYRVYDSLFHTMLVLDLMGFRLRREFEVYWYKVIRGSL
jgi:hypothetical protein